MLWFFKLLSTFYSCMIESELIDADTYQKQIPGQMRGHILISVLDHPAEISSDFSLSKTKALAHRVTNRARWECSSSSRSARPRRAGDVRAGRCGSEGTLGNLHSWSWLSVSGFHEQFTGLHYESANPSVLKIQSFSITSVRSRSRTEYGL